MRQYLFDSTARYCMHRVLGNITVVDTITRCINNAVHTITRCNINTAEYSVHTITRCIKP